MKKKLLFLCLTCVFFISTSFTPSEGFSYGYQITKEQIINIIKSAPDWANHDPDIVDCPGGIKQPCTIHLAPSTTGLANYVVTSLYQNGTASFFESRMHLSPYWAEAYQGFQSAKTDLSLGQLF